MVLGVFGLPGAGKTTFLASAAMHSMDGKKFLGIPPHEKVYTNFACPGCYKINPEDIGHKSIINSLILIDEISQFFDARDWKSFPISTRTWFQLHRHFGCDVIFCSQSYGDADKRLRNLAQRYYLLENLFLDFSCVKPINRSFDVDNGEMSEKYEIAAPIQWTLVNRRKYYHLFDSYASEMPLEVIDDELWSAMPEKSESLCKRIQNNVYRCIHGEKNPEL